MQLTERDLDAAIAANELGFLRAVMHPSACTGNCNQGRACTCQPEAAHAATDIDSDERPPMNRSDSVTVLLVMCGSVLLSVTALRALYVLLTS